MGSAQAIAAALRAKLRQSFVTRESQLEVMLLAVNKVRKAIGRVATVDMLRRLCSTEAIALARDFKSFAYDSRFVAKERVVDVYRALRELEWRDASLSSFAHILLDVLGGTFVKIAQVLAHSPGLLPKSLVAACKESLADVKTRPLAPAELRAAIEADLGRPFWSVYAYFEMEPLAQASIAQVHAGHEERSTGQRATAAVRPAAACTVDVLREGSCLRLLSRCSFARERRPSRRHRARMHRQQSAARILE